MIDPKLLDILVCPETMQALRLADGETVDRLNRAVQERELRNQGGNRIKNRIEEGLVREDGKVLYPVWNDIPVMLLDEAIRLDTLS